MNISTHWATYSPPASGGTLGSLALVTLLTLVTVTVTHYYHLPIQIPAVDSWLFFGRRFRFINSRIRRIGPVFKFSASNYHITVVSGEAWRKRFLNAKEFEVHEASTVLNCFPSEIVAHLATSIWDPESASAENAKTSAHLSIITHVDVQEIILPKIFQDMERFTSKWGDKGCFWPFEELFDIVLRISIRQGACEELADDDEASRKFSKLYWSFMASNSAQSVLIPWRKNTATRLGMLGELSAVLTGYIQGRIDAGRTAHDAIQGLIDQGETAAHVSNFAFMLLIAGVPNTATMAAWLPYFLHFNPSWKRRVISEIKSILSQRPTEFKTRPLFEQLGCLPPSIWKDSTPVLGACLQETIRIVFSTTLLRRNRGSSVHIDGHVVDADAFVAYPSSDVHMDAGIYPEPARFDPDRYITNQGQKQASSFLGWGGGRHPCLGKRFAKTEIKCIMAYFLLQFDYDLVNERGISVAEIPKVDRDHLNFNPPLGSKAFIKYRRLSAESVRSMADE